MNTLTNIQVINNVDGKPAFVIVPYDAYIKQYGIGHNLIPNQVVGMVIENAFTPIKAWREYLGFTQLEIATRLGITHKAFAQLEASAKLRKSTLHKIANALGLAVEQLNF